MRRLAVCALAASLVAATEAGAKSKWKDEPDLTGTYTITSGTLPSGTAYEGTLTIAKKDRIGGKRGSVLWAVTWNIAGREQPIEGIGVAVENAFFVAYGAEAEYGLGIYYAIARGGRREWMQPDDTLQGIWIKSNGTSGAEGLRGDTDAWTGTYRLHGHTTGDDGSIGHPYVGELAIEKAGETVQLRWSGKYTKGRDKPFGHAGIGMEVPGFMAVRWGDPGVGGVGVYLIEGDTMSGLFAETAGIGKESLTVPPEVVAQFAGR